MRLLIASILVWVVIGTPGAAWADPAVHPGAAGAAVRPVAAGAAPGATSTAAPPDTLAGWQWPLTGFAIARPFVAPAHRYGPGHRGIDLRPREASATVHAPAAGVIAFAGRVAGRAVVTIDHGGGLVTTLEPVAEPLPVGTAVAEPLPVGTAVAAGDPVAVLSTGGHAAPGTVHFGVRYDGEYINPMLLLGGVPRAVLLPCC